MFKDEQVLKSFNILVNNNKIKVSEPKRPKEVGNTKDPRYCYYHRIINHPSKDCFILRIKFRNWSRAGVLHLNEEKKQVTINMVSL